MSGQLVSGARASYRWRRLLSILTLVAVAGSGAAGIVTYPTVASLTVEIDPPPLPIGLLIASNLLGLAFSLCGYVILRQTVNRVGWILHGTGLLFGLLWIGLALSAFDAAGRDIGMAGRLVATWLGFAWYPALMLMGVLLPLLFPTGRPPSPRWNWVGAVAAIALVYGWAVVTLETLMGPLGEVLGPDSRTWSVLALLGGAGLTGAGVSVVVRYRRAQPSERLQIKWVAATFVLICLTVALGLSALLNSPAPELVLVVFALVPVSILLAITKYRLYDLDRIISRTLSYAVVIGALLAVYAAAVGLLTWILPIQSDLAVAAATLAAAGLFNPLRRRIQVWVDRRFNRTRYIAEKELDLLTGRLQDITELAGVETDLFFLLHRTLQPSTIGLWIRKPPIDRST